MAENMMMGWSLLALALMFLAMSVHAIPCEEAVSGLSPCKPFLVDDDPKPSAACCTGVETLNKEVTTKPDRQALCECLKKVGAQIGVKPDKAKKLPQFCGVAIPVPVEPGVDCSKIPLFA